MGQPTALAAGSHYLDITGEIDVFEYAHTLSHRAAAAGVVFCPGVGFDVIPTQAAASTMVSIVPTWKPPGA